MPDKQQIVRERILDAAEIVTLDSAGRVFTLDAVAERAGISKGGRVYNFTTKDGVVRAALQREITRYQAAVGRKLAGKSPTAFATVLAPH